MRSRFFVGREREVIKIEAAIASGRNVILRGKYGIGRTALVREVASRNDDLWRVIFSDFSANGRDISASILKQLLGRVPEDLSARQLARAVTKYEPRGRRKTIVVLDDLAKLTLPKIKLVRLLRASPVMLFIAIIERFVSEEALMRLRVALDPAVVVTLDHLDEESSVRFFAHHASHLRLPWTEGDIEMLARAMHGYPLEMTHIIARIQKERGDRR